MPIVYETPWFSIEANRNADGKTFYRMIEPNGVAGLVMNKDGKFVLVRQWRPALDEHTIELPAGSVGITESAVGAMARELYEETGYVCDDFTLLAANSPVAPHRLTLRVTFFFGKDAILSPCFRSRNDIEVICFNLAELKQLALADCRCHRSIPTTILLAYWKGLIESLN